MKISLFYYSGAGNTKFIAKKISTELKSNSCDVKMMRVMKKSVVDVSDEADLYIVGFPIYDLTSPELIKELLAVLKEKNKPIAFFCTKAFASGDSIKELSELEGFITVGKMELYMPASDGLLMFAKKDSLTEKILKSIHSRNIDNKVSHFVQTLLKYQEVRVAKKWYIYLSFLIPQTMKNKFHAQYSKYVPEFYSQPDICIECMKCVKGCPRENIIFDERIKFGLDCDMCLHCVHHCPTDSIQIGNMTQGNVRYTKVVL